jgi:hypothetical protein
MSVRQQCRRRRHRGYGPKESEVSAEELGSGDHRGRGDRDAAVGGVNMGGMSEVTINTPTWTELAREAAHVSTSYTYITYYVKVNKNDKREQNESHILCS